MKRNSFLQIAPLLVLASVSVTASMFTGAMAKGASIMGKQSCLAVRVKKCDVLIKDPNAYSKCIQDAGKSCAPVK